MPLSPSQHKERSNNTPLSLRTQENGLPILFLTSHTRKGATQCTALSLSLSTQGKGLPMALSPHKEKVYQRPLFLPTQGKGLPMPPLPSNTRKRCTNAPLSLPTLGKVYQWPLSLPTQGKGPTMPPLLNPRKSSTQALIPPKHKEMVSPSDISRKDKGKV